MKKDYFIEKLGCGNLTFTPFVSFFGNESSSGYKLKQEGATLCFSCEEEDFSDCICISETENGFIAKRVFSNKSQSVLKLVELGFSIDGISFGENVKDDYFYHTENPRIYEQMTFPVDYNRTCDDAANSSFDVLAGNRWADPGVVVDRIGASPYQPFPAILLSNYNTKAGLVHGTLSQRVFFHNYLVSHTKIGIKLEIFSSFKSVSYREIRQGEALIDEWYIGTCTESDNIEKIFEKYSIELRKKLPSNYGATCINRDNVVWGSWNDGIFRDVSEKMLLEEAKIITESFPTVKWLQLDDGFATFNTQAHGLGVPYESEEGIDKSKFPNGLRHFTDKLRELGLRPALWIGGGCPEKTKIFKEHPEWFCDFSERFSSMRVLDVSLNEVQSYARNAISKLCKEYGFDAVKHDFWSYAFESSGDYLKEKYASGYEHRERWLKELRNVIPSDGYLQTGCDIVMGNPFLGEYFTNYRYGIDIGVGSWENIRTNFLWGVACFATHTSDLFVPNSDAIGMFPGLNETDAQFCINYIIITNSMVELAGKFSKVDKSNPRFKMLQKAVACPNNGEDVYFGNYNYRKPGRNTPELLYTKYPRFSLSTGENLPIRTAAIFNINDEKSSVRISCQELDIPDGSYVLTNAWNGNRIIMKNSIDIELKPHESMLFSVNRSSGKQIYDSNIKLSDVTESKTGLSFQTHYAAEAELTVSYKPKKILADGYELEFSVIEDRLCFKLDSPKKITVIGE